MWRLRMQCYRNFVLSKWTRRTLEFSKFLWLNFCFFVFGKTSYRSQGKLTTNFYDVLLRGWANSLIWAVLYFFAFAAGAAAISINWQQRRDERFLSEFNFIFLYFSLSIKIQCCCCWSVGLWYALSLEVKHLIQERYASEKQLKNKTKKKTDKPCLVEVKTLVRRQPNGLEKFD